MRLSFGFPTDRNEKKRACPQIALRLNNESSQIYFMEKQTGNNVLINDLEGNL